MKRAILFFDVVKVIILASIGTRTPSKYQFEKFSVPQIDNEF